KYRRTRLFLLTLGYSRKSVRLLTWQSSTRIWAELHERAFARLGGAPAVIVLDNLREGVLRPDVYEPTLNPLYRDVLAHYGVTALPCRVGDPDRKGKVESGIGHTQRTPLKGLRFERLADAQAYLDHWETRWADTRIHGTTKRQVAAMFAEERPHLRPLPPTPVTVLRLRHPHRAPRRLRGSRQGVLPGPTRPPRPRRRRPVGRARSAHPRSRHGRATARARTAAPRAVSRAPRRPAAAHAAHDPAAPRPGRDDRSARGAARDHAPCGRCVARRAPHPGAVGAHPQVRRGGGRRRVRRRARPRPNVPVCPPLPRAPSAGAAHAAPGRSPDPPAHPLPRSPPGSRPTRRRR